MMNFRTPLQRLPLFAGGLLCAAAMLTQGVAPAAHAAVLVSDNFDSAADGSNLGGRAPDVDAGSHVWNVAGSNGTIEIDNPSGDGEVFTTGVGGIKNKVGNIRFDPGSYDKYVIGMSIDFESATDLSTFAFGFTSNVNFYTGSVITVNITAGGNVTLVGPRDYSSGGNGVVYNLAGPVTISGFDTSAAHMVKLIYDAAAHTATVNIDGSNIAGLTNVAVTDHSGATYTPTLERGSFVFQNPNNVPPNTYSRARVDDFKITATPEPGSLALLAVGGLMMLKRKRR